jgi:hypothetical protein
MRNITVSISDQTYREIRVWCAKRDVSVSRVVQTFLEDLPRLKHARRFPLPDAPPPATLRPLYEQLEPAEPAASAAKAALSATSRPQKMRLNSPFMPGKGAL